MAKIERTAAERLHAWLVTGPLGHLYGTTADVLILWARYARYRLSGGGRP